MDISKSLEEIENDYWGEPDFHSSLVLKCHHLRTIPVEQLTVENMRMLIGQQISLPILVPIACDILETNLLAEGDMYPGDLLNAVSTISSEFLKANEELSYRIQGLASDIDEASETLLRALNEIQNRV